MTKWTDIFSVRHLLSRQWFLTPGTGFVVLAPAGSAYFRASGVGAGGWDSTSQAFNSGGGAFARTKATCSPGESFTIQVGDINHSLDAGDALGDTIVKRTSGSVVVMKAVRGTNTGGGSSASCVGDVTRSGHSHSGSDGYSGGDAADPYPLGFGGRPSKGPGNRNWAAGRGGSGAKSVIIEPTRGLTWSFPPGNGAVCMEFFDQDPGY